jgi:hypothetical protein
MRSLATVGRQIEQLARTRPLRRQVLVVAGTAEAVDRARVPALEAEGVEVTVVLTGVPRDGNRIRTVPQVKVIVPDHPPVSRRHQGWAARRRAPR